MVKELAMSLLWREWVQFLTQELLHAMWAAPTPTAIKKNKQTNKKKTLFMLFFLSVEVEGRGQR